VDAQIQMISSWTSLLQLALLRPGGDKEPIPKALAADAKVRARGFLFLLECLRF
jgi:hypothetical protein